MLLSAIVSCGNGGASPQNIVGDSVVMRYSSLLCIVECDGYTVVDVKNPWSDGIMHRYILVDRECEVPPHLPMGTLLRTPLDSVLVFSTVHTRLMSDLGCADAVVGVCDSRYMEQPYIMRGISDGSIVDCGSSLNIDVEKVVQLSPQALFVLPFENGGYGKLDKLCYPLVECAEYMETSPLGCAEWMRFYGRLFGCGQRADSVFSSVCRNYECLRDSVAAGVEHRPTLLCELKSNSAWYVPGGGSTMGILYRDAGAEYLFDYDKRSGSVPLSFEIVLDRAANADFWLIKYGADEDKTYSSLLDEFAGYAHFKAFREHNIYACNVSRKRFYEETPFRPDVLLRELVAVFHPQLVCDTVLRYYEKME
ncbi:MAG: ABC transporter substrate-binding protein [Bacteroidaceae bacterium]|nr:ABC transporter substrate-binding protein [Bacteroidaceae bacterium]